MADPTAEQRKAIRAFIESTLLPLIGDVLEKKLTQAALTIRDLLEDTPAGAPGTGGGAPPAEWDEVERIRDVPEVDEALLNFKDDCTGDNAAMVVRAVMRAARGVPGPFSDQGEQR